METYKKPTFAFGSNGNKKKKKKKIGARKKSDYSISLTRLIIYLTRFERRVIFAHTFRSNRLNVSLKFQKSRFPVLTYTPVSFFLF